MFQLSDRKGRRGLSRLVGACALLAASVGGGNALELCVTCDGPAAVYTCTFNEPTVQANDPRLKLLCITELAKAGGHASCAVDRTAQQAACGGTVRVMAPPGGEAPAAPNKTTTPVPKVDPVALPPAATEAAGKPAPAVTPTAPAASTAKREPAPIATDSEAPPKTVQKMLEKSTASAGKTLEKTGEAAAEGAKTTGTALENAGKAVGNAAKKTWNCLTTLFGDC